MRFVRIALCLFTLLCSVCLSLIASSAGREHVVKKAAAFVVFPLVGSVNNTQPEKLQVIKTNIIRVSASPLEKMSPANSLVTEYTGSATMQWMVQGSKDDRIVLKTSRLVATVPAWVEMGAALFSDNNGAFISKPQLIDGRHAKPGANTIIIYNSQVISIKMKPVPRRSKWIK